MEVESFATHVYLEVSLEPLGIVWPPSVVPNVLVRDTVLLQLPHQRAVAAFAEERRPRVCRTHHMTHDGT